MHKSDNNDNNNKDTSKMQYFAANAWLLMLVLNCGKPVETIEREAEVWWLGREDAVSKM